MDDALLGRVLDKTGARLVDDPHLVRLEVGPNAVQYETLEAAGEALLDMALEHFGEWGQRYDENGRLKDPERVPA